MASSTIALQSSDGEKFEVPKEIARKSVTIKTMLEDLGLDDGDDNCEAGSSIIILYFLLKLFFFFLRYKKNKYFQHGKLWWEFFFIFDSSIAVHNFVKF